MSVPAILVPEGEKLLPAEKLNQWFYPFSAALKDRNIPAVLDLFVADCYWRDLISFSMATVNYSR